MARQIINRVISVLITRKHSFRGVNHKDTAENYWPFMADKRIMSFVRLKTRKSNFYLLYEKMIPLFFPQRKVLLSNHPRHLDTTTTTMGCIDFALWLKKVKSLLN